VIEAVTHGACVAVEGQEFGLCCWGLKPSSGLSSVKLVDHASVVQQFGGDKRGIGDAVI
jgi:hypothetical protein